VEITRTLTAPVAAEDLFVHVDDLSAYERWMPLIHDVHPLDVAAGAAPAWLVEIRAQVGPFARSKRLRMERTAHEVDALAVFERAEQDGRSHSSWVLRAEIGPTSAEESVLTMVLSYGGSLWAGAALGKVLDDQVRRGSDALLDLVTADV